MDSDGAQTWRQRNVVVVGAGMSGLVAAAEGYNGGFRMLLLDHEPEAALGEQAHWSFGGLSMFDSPEQRRVGVQDSAHLAVPDWRESAAFDRPKDRWPRRWAEAYVVFPAGKKRAWLHSLGVRCFPMDQGTGRGGSDAQGNGSPVLRSLVVWSTGPGVLALFLAKIQEGLMAGRVRVAYRHLAIELMFDGECSQERRPASRGSSCMPLPCLVLP